MGWRKRIWAVCGAAAVALVSPGAKGQSGAEWIQLRLLAAAQPNATWDQVRAIFFDGFRAGNPDERGVTPAGLADLRLIEVAQRRSRILSQVLASDLDGDGRITRAELERVFAIRAGAPV